MLNSPLASGARVRLRPVSEADYNWLESIHEESRVIGAWRNLSAGLRPEARPSQLWQGVHLQLVIESKSGEPMGVVLAYGWDDRNRTAHIGVFLSTEWRRRVAPIEGLVLFVNLLFVAFDRRVLYAEVFEPQWTEFDSTLGREMRVEVEIPSYTTLDGKAIGMRVYCLPSESWPTQRASRMLSAAFRVS